jgi:predicted nucleotidyltransferase
MDYNFPRNTPRFTREVLEETLSDIHGIVRDNLTGIYLYGSLAMECFHPESSDVDVILVVRRKVPKERRRRILEYLKGVCSRGARIELSIVCADVVRNPRYPMMVNLHYEYWGNIFEDEKDNEILSNMYTTLKRGFCVWGAPTGEVFSEIPAAYHLRSVIEDIQHTRRYLHEKRENIGYDVAVYWVLTSCRILAFIREEKVLSKLEGGLWGLANLPKEYHGLIERALGCYEGKKKGGTLDKSALEAFADYMTDIILRESRLTERGQTSHSQ